MAYSDYIKLKKQEQHDKRRKDNHIERRNRRMEAIKRAAEKDMRAEMIDPDKIPRDEYEKLKAEHLPYFISNKFMIDKLVRDRERRKKGLPPPDNSAWLKRMKDRAIAESKKASE